ncbi:ABC transporter substrate-binding protein [Haloarcula sp. GH36]|uniref:ABC transporter substrate-binding protein n=1 Tax=Haloarcula montana TaxID=3111776 RepID=UPI002D779F28|nr:ABC transporter substrate-binding protein [Haloarcula sp. GH36]
MDNVPENILPDALSRRRLIQSAAGIAAATVAGCQGDGGSGGSDGGSGSIDPVQDRVEVTPSEIQEGGTFRTAVGSNPDTFEFAESSSAQASIMHNLIFEGLTTTSASGEIYSWLAESYERVDVQEASPADYTEYMTTAPYAEGEEGAVFIDTDEQIVLQDPDNPDSPSAGDEARILTVNEAPDAVADGTYGMYFQFQLHEGVPFHNGEEMTADNVVASYNRLQNSSLSGQVYDSLLHIAADGDYTVDLYVQTPDAAAIRELGDFPIYPSEVTENLELGQMDPRQGNTPLGTGPFELAEFANEDFVRFTKFDDHWFETGMKEWFDGPSEFPNGPVVDEVDISIISSDAQRSAALQNDEIDMAFGLTASTLTNFQESEEYRTAPTNGAGYTFLQFPVRQEPWTNAKLRRAVNKLIPRQTISDEIFQGWEQPAWVPLPPLAAGAGSTDYDAMVEDLQSYNTYDTEEATQIAQEAVDELGIETPIEVTLETNSDNDDRVRTVELIAESMNQTEFFDVTVNTKEFLTFISQLLSENYWQEGKLAFIGLSGGFNPHGYAKSVHHPDNFAQCCNFQNIDIQELNDQLREARYGVDVVEDPSLRAERYETVWETVLEQNANSYGTHSTLVGVVNDSVNGFNTYPSTQDIVGYAMYNAPDQQVTYLDQ